MTTKENKPRPYWHVDAKWVTGILSILVLIVTFAVFLLFKVTSPEQGIEILTATMASMFSYEGGGLDQAGDIEIMKDKIAESPNGEYQPIPGMDITVRMEDIEGKSPREARLWFFRQMAEPLYTQGQQGLIEMMTDPEMKESVSGGVGPLALISASTHAKLGSVLIICGLISFFLLGMLIFFSYRFGRLGNPGFVIFMAAIPNLILLAVLQGVINNPTNGQGDEGIQSTLARYSQLAADVLPDVIDKALIIHVVLVIVGIALMLIGLIGVIFFRQKKKTDQPEPAG
ncbi:MAG TPA: hypothetical protein VJZ78_01280 [Anaerolineales bacterium]|nr:hypothetical protein [Anaerolineales bacterium]